MNAYCAYNSCIVASVIDEHLMVFAKRSWFVATEIFNATLCATTSAILYFIKEHSVTILAHLNTDESVLYIAYVIQKVDTGVI